jgi:hypothetical protein
MTREALRPRGRPDLSTLQPSQSVDDPLRQKHVVADGGDLLGFLPALLEHRQLSLERAPFVGLA